MFDYKNIFGYVSTFLVLVGAFRYARDTVRAKTRPHAFTWLVWGLLSGIAFVAQVISHAGAGSWIVGASSLYSLAISIYAFFYGDRKFTAFDWKSLSGALLGILLWVITKQPVIAVIIVSITDFLGFLPTYKKAFFKPFEETLSEYVFSSIAMLIGLFALSEITLTTTLYPATLVLSNGAFAILLVVRRNQMKS